MKLTKPQLLAAVAAGLTAVGGLTAGAVAFGKHQAHVKQCNEFAERAIGEYFEAQDIMAQTQDAQDKLNRIDAEDGLFALMQLGNAVEAANRSTAMWDAFEDRTKRTSAEFEAVCGAARVNQMKTDLRQMVQSAK